LFQPKEEAPRSVPNSNYQKLVLAALEKEIPDFIVQDFHVFRESSSPFYNCQYEKLFQLKTLYEKVHQISGSIANMEEVCVIQVKKEDDNVIIDLPGMNLNVAPINSDGSVDLPEDLFTSEEVHASKNSILSKDSHVSEDSLASKNVELSENTVMPDNRIRRSLTFALQATPSSSKEPVTYRISRSEPSSPVENVEMRAMSPDRARSKPSIASKSVAELLDEYHHYPLQEMAAKKLKLRSSEKLPSVVTSTLYQAMKEEAIRKKEEAEQKKEDAVEKRV